VTYLVKAKSSSKIAKYYGEGVTPLLSK
jgi:hypothetical protein